MVDPGNTQLKRIGLISFLILQLQLHQACQSLLSTAVLTLKSSLSVSSSFSSHLSSFCCDVVFFLNGISDNWIPSLLFLSVILFLSVTWSMKLDKQSTTCLPQHINIWDPSQNEPQNHKFWDWPNLQTTNYCHVALCDTFLKAILNFWKFSKKEVDLCGTSYTISNISHYKKFPLFLLWAAGEED